MAILLSLRSAAERKASIPPKRSDFIGSASCGTCHQAQYKGWKASQHALAMQDARPETVLGQFNGTRFAHNGVTTTFRREGERFVVNTEGPDGTMQDFVIRYTFGVFPLQQYLVSFPGGRLQPLTIAWDARPSEQGGQRWFSLEESGRVGPHDELHWTGRGLNWNFMCADCHSTGVRKGYIAGTDEFKTTFADTSVACEACHGPGSEHATWGSRPAWLRRSMWRGNGLEARLVERHGVSWSIDSITGNARRSAPRATDSEIGVCAQCHARRAHIADGYTAGSSFFDYYDPFPLLAGFYYADGQQEDEVYDYGSFLQSRMYAFGVTCSDCHDPHTQKLRRPGNLVCTQCHRAAKYDTLTHHGHRQGSPGAACSACHMPTTTYMGIDPRHDHSLRVPRPDRTIAIGVPNACTQCHADKTPAWAAQSIVAHTGKAPDGFQGFAETFAAADRHVAGAEDSLEAIVADPLRPTIVRASALARLGAFGGPSAMRAAEVGARDPSPMVRRWALDAIKGLPPADRVRIGEALLRDSTRMVRQEAASVLAGFADSLKSPESRRAFDVAAAEFVASQKYNADRAENRATLGVFYLERGRTDSAETQFRAAVQQWPQFVDGYIDLAGLLSLRKREGDAERVLRDALTKLSGDPRLHHALGLSLARSGRLPEATKELEEANRLSAFDPEYAYPYAVVLHGTGRVRDAVRVLEASRRVAPTSRDVLYALSTFSRDAGDMSTALRYAKELAQAFPRDPQASALLRSLESRTP